VQEIGRALGLGVEVKQFLNGRAQLRVAGTPFIQKRPAPLGVQVDRLLEQRSHSFRGWLEHGYLVVQLKRFISQARM
jgi:hypothetical protein